MTPFSLDLPQQEYCSAFKNSWPMAGKICSGNAIDCIIPPSTVNDTDTYSCVCAEGWTGKGDFISRDDQDCNISDEVTRLVLIIYIASAAVCGLMVFLWNIHSIKAAYRHITHKPKRKPLLPKTVSFLGFILECIWCIIGTSYRMVSGGRYGYDPVSTFFISISISGFLWFFFYFIVSWVKLSVSASSTGPAKLEHKKKGRRILKVLRAQLYMCTILIIACYNYAAMFIEEEVSSLRTTLINAANLFTVLSTAFMGISLFKSGRELSDVVKKAGDGDLRLKLLGDNMLKTTRILTHTLIMTIMLLLATTLPTIEKYKAYLIPLTYSVSHMIPITISVLLTTPPWKVRTKVSPDSQNSSAASVMSSMGWISAITSKITGGERRMSNADIRPKNLSSIASISKTPSVLSMSPKRGSCASIASRDGSEVVLGA